MLQLIYISTATTGLTQAAVGDILTASWRANAASGITGMLLYDGYHFLQALEGDAASVRATYARIRTDPRHRAVVLLSQSEVARPTFGGLAMAGQRVRVARGDTLAELIDRLTDSVADPAMQEAFRGFAHAQPRLAA